MILISCFEAESFVIESVQNFRNKNTARISEIEFWVRAYFGHFWFLNHQMGRIRNCNPFKMEINLEVMGHCGTSDEDFRMGAVEVYLRCAELAAHQCVHDVEVESILHQNYNTEWMLAVANARNVVRSVQTCLKCCSDRNLSMVPIALAALNRAETVLVWSVAAARALHVNGVPIAYSIASKLMLQSEHCLWCAIQADEDVKLHALWISAGESAAETYQTILPLGVLHQRRHPMPCQSGNGESRRCRGCRTG